MKNFPSWKVCIVLFILLVPKMAAAEEISPSPVSTTPPTTMSPTPTATASPAVTATASASPSATVTSSPTPTATATTKPVTKTATPRPTVALLATPSPTIEPTATPVPTFLPIEIGTGSGGATTTTLGGDAIATSTGPGFFVNLIVLLVGLAMAVVGYVWSGKRVALIERYFGRFRKPEPKVVPIKSTDLEPTRPPLRSRQ